MRSRSRRLYRKHKAIERFAMWVRMSHSPSIPHNWQHILEWSRRQLASRDVYDQVAAQTTLDILKGSDGY